jgi:hypothetical protein
MNSDKVLPQPFLNQVIDLPLNYFDFFLLEPTLKKSFEKFITLLSLSDRLSFLLISSNLSIHQPFKLHPVPYSIPSPKKHHSFKITHGQMSMNSQSNLHCRPVHLHPDLKLL